MNYIRTPTGTIKRKDLQGAEPDRKFRDAWIASGKVIELDRAVADEIIKRAIKKEMRQKIEDGILWHGYVVKATPNMIEFLRRASSSIAQNPNIHGGVLFQDGGQFAIDDAGIVELASFVLAWSVKMQQVASTLIAELPSMADGQIENYKPESIDWTVSWSAQAQSKGWFGNAII